MMGKREPFVVTGPRLVVSLFGQGRRQRGASLAPCSWRGGEGAGSGVGREGLLAALTAQGLPVAPSRTRVLPRRDQCPDPSGHGAPGWARPSEQ